MVEIPERRAVVSGVGISTIGRKTATSALELTRQAASAAIADAGLRAADIDGIATMGETAPSEIAADLGIRHRWTGSATCAAVVCSRR